MIHTYEQQIAISNEQIERIMFHYDFKSIQLVLRKVEKELPGTTLTFMEKDFGTYINVHIDAIIALKTYDIKPQHIIQLHEIHETICDYLMIDAVESLNLTRNDFRVDSVGWSKVERTLILKLLHKTKHKYGHMKKGVKKYKTTVELENGSMKAMLYDKEEQRKVTKGKVNDEEIGVLRFEVALRNGHLKYNKKKKGMPKELQTYLKEELHLKYMRKIVEIFFPGNFYYLSDAELMLKEIQVKKVDRDWIREIMVMMSERGYEGVKEAFSDYKIEKCLKILREGKIHPVPIPKNEKVQGYSRETPLRNPVDDILRAIEAYEMRKSNKKTEE
jgi:hypothetical protein